MKKAILGILAGALVMSTAASAASTMNFAINGTNVDVFADTNEIKTTAHPIYVPVDKSYISTDDVKTFLGAEVETLGESSAKLTKNGDTYTVDGCVEKDGVFYVPFRTAAEMTGFDVDYIYSYNSILISDKPAAVKVNGETGVSSDQLKFYLDNMLRKDVEFPDEIIEQAKQEALKTLIKNAVIYQKAEESGFVSTTIDDEIIQSIKTNSQGFETPAIAALENEKLLVANFYTGIVADAIMPPTDEEIASYYAENFVTAKHILVLSENGRAASDEEAKKQAEEILKQVKAGKDFDALINEFGEDGGMQYNPDGYTFTAGEMIKEFEEATFALEENEVSEIIKTNYGYHIIKRLPLAEITDDVKEVVSSIISGQEYHEFIQNLEETAVIERNEEVISSIK